MSNRYRAYFEFELSEDLDCKKTLLAFCVQQQGDRLGNYRGSLNNKFEHSYFNLVLVDGDTRRVIKYDGGWGF